MRIPRVIALSFEPTMEEINNLPSDCKKGTDLEMILMELKNLTIRFNKQENIITKTSNKLRNLMIPTLQNFSEIKLKLLKMST